MTRNITAIILNYKNYHDVRACILSLLKQALAPDCHLHLLIIDNNSGDDYTKRLEAEFPEHQYIYNENNLGFAKGVNQGIHLSRDHSDYFLLVNNDAELAPACLRLLLETSQGSALTGPAIMYKEEADVIWQGGGFFSQLRMNIVVPDKNKVISDREPQNVDFLSGCILLIPKSAIDHLGRLDEKFFFYGEDLDFCLRAKRAGIEVLYCSQAHAWHNIQRAAISRTSAFVLKNLAFSHQLIIKKHFPARRLYGALLFIFVYTPFRLKQIIQGGNDWRNIGAWLKGAKQAWFTKI